MQEELHKLEKDIANAVPASSADLYPREGYVLADMGACLLADRSSSIDRGGGSDQFLYEEAQVHWAREVRDVGREIEEEAARLDRRAAIMQLSSTDFQRQQQAQQQRQQQLEQRIQRARAGEAEALLQQQRLQWGEWWKKRRQGRDSPFQSRDEMEAAVARLWLLRAALGDHCRHCVDACPDLACPECSGYLDDDPGRGAQGGRRGRGHAC